MPVVAAPLFGFALGALFAWAASEELSRTGGAVTSRSLVVAASFGILVYAPAAAYFTAFFPDWSYAYFVDSEHRSIALDVALVMFTALSVPLGFTLLSGAAAARKSATLARVAAAACTVATVFLFTLLPRLRVIATFAQFHGDFGTEPLAGSPVGLALIWMTTVVAFSAAWTTRMLRRLADPSTAN
jgi:hypothetical protein